MWTLKMSNKYNVYILHILLNFIYFIRHAGLQKKKGGIIHFTSWSWRTTLLRIYIIIIIMHNNRGKCRSQITTSQWCPQDTKGRGQTSLTWVFCVCCLISVCGASLFLSQEVVVDSLQLLVIVAPLGYDPHSRLQLRLFCLRVVALRQTNAKCQLMSTNKTWKPWNHEF